MNTRKLSLITVVAAALLAPALSMADTPWVPANNEQGYNYDPAHATSSPQGVQGRSAPIAAAPGALFSETGSPTTMPSTATGKTREQVRNEYLNMSAAEKQRMQELYRGN